MAPEALWKALGGAGESPSCLGAFSGPLLVLGGGRSAWDDYAQVRPWKGEIMAVNDSGMHLHDRVRHWLTLHPEYLPGWLAYRMGHLYGQGVRPTTHSNKSKPDVDKVWKVDNVGGTSGLFACFVGLMLGYTEIVLAGVPMDNTGHYFDPPWYRSEFDDRCVRSVWKQAKTNYFAGRVTSLSGYTRELLGAPASLKVAA